MLCPLSLLCHSPPHSTQEGCCAGAGVASALWQVFACLQDLIARLPEDALGLEQGMVSPERLFSLAGSLSIGCHWGGDGDN